MRGKPVVAEAGMTLQQPEVHHLFSWGSCPWITGPWQWWATEAPGRGGVDSDLCLHTGFLVAAAAAINISYPSLVSMLIATVCALL